eukprot:15438809-Heterocapsa_arctica.AAC.1
MVNNFQHLSTTFNNLQQPSNTFKHHTIWNWDSQAAWILPAPFCLILLAFACPGALQARA